MRKAAFFIASAIVAGAAFAPAAFAQTTISTGSPDDAIAPLGKDGSFGQIPTAIAQTFQAPTGTQFLQSFTFYYTNFINGGGVVLNAAVYAFDSDHLTGSALFEQKVAGTENDVSFDAITLGSPASPLNVLLTPGTTYALVLDAAKYYDDTPDGSTVAVGAVDEDLYAGGDLFVSELSDESSLFDDGAFFETGTPADAAFTETPMTPTPEPNSLVLAATGLTGLAGLARRRSSQKAA